MQRFVKGRAHVVQILDSKIYKALQNITKPNSKPNRMICNKEYLDSTALSLRHWLQTTGRPRHSHEESIQPDIIC